MSWEQPGLVSPAGVSGLHGLPFPLSRFGGWISDLCDALLSHCSEAIHVLGSSAGIWGAPQGSQAGLEHSSFS